MFWFIHLSYISQVLISKTLCFVYWVISYVSVNFIVKKPPQFPTSPKESVEQPTLPGFFLSQTYRGCKVVFRMEVLESEYVVLYWNLTTVSVFKDAMLVPRIQA